MTDIVQFLIGLLLGVVIWFGIVDTVIKWDRRRRH